MRKEPFSKNDYVHIYNRGNRKQSIVHDSRDRNRFLQMLYYFNTENTPFNQFQELSRLKLLRFNLNNSFVWPDIWQPRDPIVAIIAFALMNNHFHLLLKEIKEGGISKFMQRLGTGMTMYYNTKYQESGCLFQGSYKAKRIDEDMYLRYISVYIQIKNPLELYTGGLKKAVKEFNKAYDWVIDYPYNSLGDFVGTRNSGIIDKDIFSEIFVDQKEYKEFSRDCMLNMNLDEALEGSILE